VTRERENVPSFYAVGIGVLSLFITTVLFIPAFLSYLPVHSPGAVSARQKPSLPDRLLIRRWTNQPMVKLRAQCKKIYGQYNSADWFNGFFEKTLH
jgi:hypothetical protein